MSRRWRAIFLIGALAGLCFSAGEGLRLTPLPAQAAPAQSATPGDGDQAAGSAEAAPRKYGPLDKPSQSRFAKRGKRQSPDCECPPLKTAAASCDHPRGDTCHAEPAGRARTIFLRESAGRAPPRRA